MIVSPASVTALLLVSATTPTGSSTIEGVEYVAVACAATSLTTTPLGEVPLAVTVLLTAPALTSAWLIVTVTVQVVDPPTGRVVAAQTGVPSTVSVTPTPVSATVPWLVSV